MYQQNFRTYLTIIIWLSCLFPGLSQAAANLTYTPTVINISPDYSADVITLINNGDNEINMEVTAKSWDSNDKGEFVETDTGDFTFYPHLVTIPAHQKEVVNVGYEGDFPAKEKPYRVYITELPPIKKANIEKNHMAIVSLLKVSLPLFVKPDGELHEAKPELEGVTVLKDKISVRVRNPEVTNFLVRDIQLQWLDNAQKTLATTKSILAKRVLAKRFTLFDLPLIKASCTQAVKLTAQISIDGQKTPFTKEFPLHGQCAP